MAKVIRATIEIEVPYSNEFMNYGDKFDKELRRVIDATPYLNCKVEAGELEPSRNATIRLDEDKFSDRARPDGFIFNERKEEMKGMYIPEYKDET